MAGLRRCNLYGVGGKLVTRARFVLGDWRVDPASRSLARGGEQVQLEPRTMDLLVELCAQPGAVLSAEHLLSRCWPDQPSGDNPVHKHIALLRRALGDSAQEPLYIETLRKRGYRINASVRSLDAAQPQARAGAWRGGSPFRGLQAFDERHAEVFYGREQATQALWDAVRLQWRHGQGLCLLLGPSGSGKTSLLRAGLIPYWLSQHEAQRPLASHAVLDLGDVSSAQDAAAGAPDAQALLAALHLALAATLLDWELDNRACFPGASAQSLARSLAETPKTVAHELRAAVDATARATEPAGAPMVLLVLDRLEGLFALCADQPAVASAWLATVQQLSEHAPVMVLAACRNDYYPQVAAQPWLMQAKACGAQLDLAPPGAAEIAQMVRLPARAAGLSFEQDPASLRRLDDVLVDAAARSPDALPLLQYALQQLYTERDAHGQLGFAAYRALGGGEGGLEGLIAAQAEQLLQSLSPEQQAGLPQVLALLVTLAEDESAPVASHRARWSDLAGPAERELVQALVDARLLVSDGREEFAVPADADAGKGAGAASTPGFRVAHEALLRRWPRVTAWIAQHRQNLHTRSRLREQVQRWREGGRAAEFLLPQGRQLHAAQALLRSGPWALGADEQVFVQASSRRVRWAAQLRRAAIAGLALLALLAALFAWRALQAEAQARAKRASSERLLGYLLGEAAEQMRPEGRLALLEGVSQQALAVLGDEADIPQLSAEERLQRAKALLLLGEVQYKKRQPAIAGQAFRAALALSRSSSASQLNPAQYKAWGAAEFWLGELDRDAGDLDRAEAHQLAYRDVCRLWREAWPKNDEARLELGMAEGNLGVLALRRMRAQPALNYFAESNQVTRSLLAERPEHLPYIQDLVSGLTWSMEAAVMAGQPRLTLAFADEALALAARWQAQAPQDLQALAALASVHDWRSQALRALAQWSELELALQQVLTLRVRLAATDPDNITWQLTQLRAQLNLWLAQPRPQWRPSELLAATRQLEGWKARVAESEWQPVAFKLLLLQARQQLRAGHSADALLILKQAPPRPKNGVQNLLWAELQTLAEWDMLWLQLLQLDSGPDLQAFSAACSDVQAFWASLPGLFTDLSAQVQQCQAVTSGRLP